MKRWLGEVQRCRQSPIRAGVERNISKTLLVEVDVDALPTAVSFAPASHVSAEHSLSTLQRVDLPQTMYCSPVAAELLRGLDLGTVLYLTVVAAR